MRQLRLNAAMCRVLGLPDEAAGLGLRLTDHGPELRGRVVRGLRPAGGADRGAGAVEGLQPIPDAGRVAGLGGQLVAGQGPGRPGVRRAGRRARRDRAVTWPGERLALVNEASTRIGSTLDVTRTAEELVEVAVPRLADFATIDLLDSVLRGDEPASGPGRRHRAAAPDGLRLGPGGRARGAWSGRGRCPPSRRLARLPGCLTTGRSVSYADAETGVARWAGHDPVPRRPRARASASTRS